MVYDINIRKLKHSYLSGVILFVIGIIFLFILGSHYLSVSNIKEELSGKVTAYRVDWINESNIILKYYSPTYYYKIGNNEYVCNSNEYTTFKDNNDIVYYNVNEPSKCLTGLDVYVNNMVLYMLVVPAVFIICGIYIILGRMKKNRLIKRLATYGTLVKRVPYQVYSTTRKENGQVIKYLCVKYTFPDGRSKFFKSNYFTDNSCDNHGVCDLLFDEKNLNSYFIDFEIKTTGKGEPKIINYEQIKE